MKSRILQFAVGVICVIFAFGFGRYLGEVFAIYGHYEKVYAKNETTTVQVLRVAVKDGQAIAKEDLETQTFTKAWTAFDAVKKAEEAVGKKAKTDLPAGHVVSEHELFID